jgi:glyoxylase-like metal-dependent hydrolase (beta-lactamase superfamily II)
MNTRACACRFAVLFGRKLSLKPSKPACSDITVSNRRLSGQFDSLRSSHYNLLMVRNFDLGEATITILGVASVRRDFDQLSEIFPTVEKSELKKAIRAVQPAIGGEYLDWNFNLALIQIPGHTILIDTGFGFSSGGPGRGTALLLKECGVRPEEVNTIVITHGHGDHIGGLTEGGAPAMPDARVVISRKEFEFWMEGQAERFFAAEASSAQQTALSICGKQIESIDMDSTIAESTDSTIRALPSPGHTPGHIGIDIRSQEKQLWLLVDTLHALFQLQHYDWSPRFDMNPELARETRRDLLGQAAKLGVPVHLYHFPFPGLGTIEESGLSFSFTTIDR